MNLEFERMCHAGHRRPPEGQGFGGLYQQGFYINYLHGLDYLCRRYLSKNKKVLELGCFYGASSELFSEYSDSVTCVDLELYPEMEDVIKKRNINFFKDNSIAFLKKINVGEYDFIYIDTTHDFGQTREEMLISYEKLNDGGIISGHDYNCHGVHNAITSTFEYPDIEIYLDSSWSIQKNSRLKIKKS